MAGGAGMTGGELVMFRGFPDFKILKFSKKAFLKHAAVLQEKIYRPELLKKLSEREQDCLYVLLYGASIFAEQQKECYEWREKFKRAETAILSAGQDKERMNKALSYFGLKIKEAKLNRYADLKAAWEALADHPAHKSSSGAWQIHVPYFSWAHGAVTIEWEDHPKKNVLDRRRGKAIIESLRKIFRLKTSGAVIKKLRDLGAMRLPAHDNSGYRWKSEQQR